jgi:ABC-type uncharacterized transport system substrate-binding protein
MWNFGPYARAILVIALLFIWTLPAAAHPHIFVRYNVTIAPGDAGFINLHFTFKVREMASPFLTPGDQPLLARDMLVNLEQHPFFIYLDIDGTALGRQTVHLSANSESGRDKIYSFDLALPATFGSFGFALYDPTYFVLVTQDGASAVTAKVDGLSCSVQTQMVGKTVWGDLHTDYVQCGTQSAPRPVIRNSKKQIPEEFPQNGRSPLTGEGLAP